MVQKQMCFLSYNFYDNVIVINNYNFTYYCFLCGMFTTFELTKEKLLTIFIQSQLTPTSDKTHSTSHPQSVLQLELRLPFQKHHLLKMTNFHLVSRDVDVSGNLQPATQFQKTVSTMHSHFRQAFVTRLANKTQSMFQPIRQPHHIVTYSPQTFCILYVTM